MQHTETVEPQGARRPEHYKANVGDENLQYQPVFFNDPVPTGRQVLEAMNLYPTADYSVFQLLPNGQLEGLRHDETTDLRQRGVEKYLVFHSDRSFRFELDGRVFEWGADKISGGVLKTLAGVDQSAYGVWQEIRGGEDKALGAADRADLTDNGVERFFTGIVKTTEGAV